MTEVLTELCRSQLNDRNNDFSFHNEATEGKDCNVAMVSEAAEIKTGIKLTAKETRARGLEPTGTTGSHLAGRVFESLGMEKGLDGDYITFVEMPIQDLRALLDAGWFVDLFVMYGALREAAPELVCDGRYSGAHSVAIFDWWRSATPQPHGRRTVHIADPLSDGRASGSLGHRAPQGVRAVPFRPVRDAAYAYSKLVGTVSGWAVNPKHNVVAPA
jgi:hypothetical protein